jgi:hypothetical protein
MSDDPRVKRTRHCSMCPATLPTGRNMARVRLDDEEGVAPRITVCPIHDVAGPVEALPLSLRPALPRSGRRHA